MPTGEENVPVVHVMASDSLPGINRCRHPSSQDDPDDVEAPHDPAVKFPPGFG